MRADDPKVAPSLADRYEAYIERGEREPSREEHNRILAALRAVEAVRAFPKYRCVQNVMHRHGASCQSYREGVEAVQALLEGER